MNIYLDMDGVLCNFTEQFKNITNIYPDEYQLKYGEEKFWNEIENAGVEYWSTMKWNTGSKQLYKFVINNFKKVEILTSTPYSIIGRKFAMQGKKIWVKNNLDNIKINFSNQKYKYATPNSILIDDMESNIDDWNNAGGIGILFKNINQVINNLKELIK